MNASLRQRLTDGAPVLGLGLMAGTSADGVDAALVRLTAPEGRPVAELLRFVCRPYPAELRARLERCFRDEATVSEVSRLHFEIGAEFAAAAALEEARTADFVASHGQTVWHAPPGAVAEGPASTLQLGQPAILAARLGCPVVSDFRPADMVAGGEGAPLVPLVDWLLFAHETRRRAVQNLGGIGNVTYLPAGGSESDVIAFDTGPGNALMDAAVLRMTEGAQRYDAEGRLAAAGAPLPAAREWLWTRPEIAAYLNRPPPKSTGRELFRLELVNAMWARGWRGADLLATLTEFTAETIAAAYRDFLDPVDEVILGGGGARNPALRRELAQRLQPASIRTHEDFGLDSEAKEAVAFAVLGYQTLRGRAGNLPSATGARQSVILGAVTPPPTPEEAA